MLKICLPPSHLLQMRGLKHAHTCCHINRNQSHLLQMRGLKHNFNFVFSQCSWSHLLQMRGLKPLIEGTGQPEALVASFTDAWIETVIILRR